MLCWSISAATYLIGAAAWNQERLGRKKKVEITFDIF